MEILETMASGVSIGCFDDDTEVGHHGNWCLYTLWW